LLWAVFEIEIERLVAEVDVLQILVNVAQTTSKPE
jgi:hypothetical protein